METNVRRWLGSGTAILLLLLAMTPSAAAQQLDSAAEETAYLLKQAITSRNPSQRDRLLQTLRRMRDPAAAPIYQHLAGVSDPVRQGHGILGLAETGTNSALTI